MTKTHQKALKHSLGLLGKVALELYKTEQRAKALEETIREERCKADNAFLQRLCMEAGRVIEPAATDTLKDAAEWLKSIEDDASA